MIIFANTILQINAGASANCLFRRPRRFWVPSLSADSWSRGSQIMWPKSYFGHDKSSVMNQYQVVDPKMLIWPAGFNDEIYILNRLIKSFNLSFIKQKKTVPWSWFNVSMPILFRTVFVRIIPHRQSHGHT